MKGLTHLDAHQKQTCFECYKKTKGRQQSMLDQQLTSTEQSQKTKAISVADNHGHFAQMF
jgi:hypothetical protein